MPPWRELFNRIVPGADSRREQGLTGPVVELCERGTFSPLHQAPGNHTDHETTMASSTNLTVIEPDGITAKRRIINKINVQQLILKALQKNDIKTFKSLLNEDVNLNEKYDKTTLLNIASASKHDEKVEFVELLLNAGADPNVGDYEDRNALHHAAFAGNEKIMRLLLENSTISVDVNALNVSGNTPLHDATSPRWDLARIDSVKRCIKMLMEHDNVQFNLPNYFGNTPIWLAQEQPSPYNRELLQVLLVCGGDRIDVSIYHLRSGDTMRKWIEANIPTLIRFLPKCRENLPFVDPLMEMILSPNPHLDDFKTLLNRENFNVNERFGNPYYCTCLELACRRKDLPESFLIALIKKGADIEVRDDMDYPQKIYCSALHQAASIANYTAIKVLLSSLKQETLNMQNYYGYTALHIAAQKRCTLQEEPDMKKCLHLLVGVTDKDTEADDVQSIPELFNQQPQRRHIDVNIPDECKGDTALHDAAFYANDTAVMVLLEGGADLMLENDDGVRPINLIDVDTLKKFLDTQIGANHKQISSKDFEVRMRYTSLYCKDSEYEMYVIDHISRSSEHRQLLQHPIVLSFIDLKWHLVRWLFYTQLAIFVFFSTCFTAYIFLTKNDCEDTERSQYENPPQILDMQSNDSNNNDNNCTRIVQFTAFNVTYGEGSVNGLRIICIIPLIILILLELLQCTSYRSRYFRDWENIFEICTFTLCAITLSKEWTGDRYAHISGIAILLTWVELVLISGRTPILSLQLAMLKKVTVTFFRFMIWYSLLIVAFALSFYILFGKTKNNVRKSTEDFFLYPDSAILKTIIMMVGDLSVSYAMLGNVQGTSHLIFLIFIFLIIIILLNLLNGLAVSDTQAIQNDAKTLSLVSRVKLTFYLEIMLVAVGTRFWGDFFKERIEPMFRVFEPSHQEKKIIIETHHRKISFHSFQRDDPRFTSLRADCEVVSNLKRLYIENNKSSDLDDLKQLLIKIQNKVEELEKVQTINKTRKCSIK